METRKWFIAGGITGGLALLLLAAITGYALSHNPPMTLGMMVLGVVDLLLGIASIKLIGDAITMNLIDNCTSRYVHGVGDTVDRLASALPPKDNVRRLG